MIKRLAALAAALGLVLVMVAPALAQDLHQTLPIAWNDAQYQGTEADCADANLEPGQVLWVFVGHFSSPDATMSATFDNSADNVTDISPTKTLDSYELQWLVYTGEDTLLSASVTPDTDTDGFNLSHICAAPPTEIPEAPFSALLVLSGGIGVLAFLGLRMRRSQAIV